jgi:hypothetical protein
LEKKVKGKRKNSFVWWRILKRKFCAKRLFQNEKWIWQKPECSIKLQSILGLKKYIKMELMKTLCMWKSLLWFLNYVKNFLRSNLMYWYKTRT